MTKVLNIEKLYVSFDTYAGEVQAVRGVSYHVEEGEVLAVVGESGCGKSVTAQTIMKLNPMPPARIKSGKLTVNGTDIIAANEAEMMNIRGKEVSMIFQDPMTSLNPTMSIGKQIVEAIVRHQEVDKKTAQEQAVAMLKKVQIPNAEERFKQYPHEFSGGMRQRVMIAMALSCHPKLLIADEPTTALDVTIQAQIIDLLAEIRKEMNTAIILITHDLGVVAKLADRIAVMYAGKIVETGTSREIFNSPAHPYTVALLNSLPKRNTKKSQRLISIPGTPPDLIAPPQGCAFADRCVHGMKICHRKQPPIFTITSGHESACWLHHKDCPKVHKEDSENEA